MNSKLIHYLLFFTLLITQVAFANNNIDQQITQLLQTAPTNDLTQRINYFSAALLNTPYVVEPFGEGADGEFNQGPLYRLDGFDCQTFVETVMALSLAHNLTKFKLLINNIRYANGHVAFSTRNHFPSADWLPNNARNGFIQDITKDVAGKNNIAVAKVYINRQQWYQYLTIERIKIPNLTTAQLQTKLEQLHTQGQQATNTWASIDYIPLKKLIGNTQTSRTILSKIPNGSIILIVNHLPTKAVIGTDLNVTHMGFAIWKNNQLYLRAASTQLKHVADIPLTNYLLRKSWLSGISVWETLPFTSNA